MNAPVHSSSALFKGEKPFPIVPSREHYAGSELHDRASYRCYRGLPQKASVTGADIPPEAENTFFQQPRRSQLCRPGDSAQAG